MIINPERIVFESTKDVVDYISKGLPPTKNQFDRLMNAVNNPVDSTESLRPGYDVIITKESVKDWNDPIYVQNTVNEILHEVYRNKVAMRNTMIATGAIVIIGGITIAILSSSKK